MGTRTSSKNTWLWTASPEDMTIGRTVTPGLVMSISRKVMPCCLRPLASVRTRQNIQLATLAWVVQILVPVHTR